MRRPERVTDRGELRKVAREILNERISSATQAEYLRIEKRLGGKHWHEYAVENQLINVAPVRAAWRRKAANDVLNELSKSESADLSPDERKAARAQAETIVEELNRPISYQRPAARRRSKRDGQCKLPSDWREQLLAAMPEKYQFQFVVMVLTGARPEEIRRGFSIGAIEGGLIEVMLEGAKCSNVTGGGQTWRRLVVDPKSSLPKHWLGLHSMLTDLGKSVTYPPTSGLGLQKAITRVALDKLGYQKISAYSVRHCFASDLKRSKTDGDAISMALGHVSRNSKQLYGRWQVGKSGKSPLVCVEAAKALTGEERIPPWLAHELSKKKGFDNKS